MTEETKQPASHEELQAAYHELQLHRDFALNRCIELRRAHANLALEKTALEARLGPVLDEMDTLKAEIARLKASSGKLVAVN